MCSDATKTAPAGGPLFAILQGVPPPGGGEQLPKTTQKHGERARRRQEGHLQWPRCQIGRNPGAITLPRLPGTPFAAKRASSLCEGRRISSRGAFSCDSTQDNNDEEVAQPVSPTTATDTSHADGTAARLPNLPISIFSIVMGMAGTAIVYLRAGERLWDSLLPGIALTALTTGLFAVIAIAYGAKTLRHFDWVRAEFNSPVKLHFFPTISISLILLSIAFLHLQPTLSLLLWAVGTVAHLLFTLKTLSIWIQKDHFGIDHIEPSWFIPVVGNILVPIAGVELAHADISWFFFSNGLIFWIMLFTIFLYRIIFHHPLASKRLPTFFILMAPPAVGFISYVRLTGEVDSLARVLYFFALFLFLLFIYQWRMFRSAQFFISWWAYSFPIAALTVATVLMTSYSDARWVWGLSWGLVGLLTIVVAALTVLTCRAACHREICRPED